MILLPSKPLLRMKRLLVRILLFSSDCQPSFLDGLSIEETGPLSRVAGPIDPGENGVAREPAHLVAVDIRCRQRPTRAFEGTS